MVNQYFTFFPTFFPATRQVLPALLKEKCVYINESQYFEGVTKEIWEYQIGGYQVSNKWLKDRKKKSLSLDDIKHYCKIVTSLQKTIKVQKAIDDIFPEVEKETLEIENR